MSKALRIRVAYCPDLRFLPVPDTVDEETADFLRTEVSDGIIAPGYTDEALAILAKKKVGSFIVLQGDPAAIAASSGVEYREGEVALTPQGIVHAWIHY